MTEEEQQSYDGSMPDEQKFENSLVSPNTNSFNTKLLFSLIAMLLVVGLGLGYYLFTKGVFDLPFIPKKINLQPTTYEGVLEVRKNMQPSSLLESCKVTKENNPLVKDVQKVDNFIMGFFYGNISNISYDAENKSATFELVSPGAIQRHTFNVKDENGLLVIDHANKKNISLGDLQPAQFVSVVFNCFPELETDQFKIIQIELSSPI